MNRQELLNQVSKKNRDRESKQPNPPIQESLIQFMKDMRSVPLRKLGNQRSLDLDPYIDEFIHNVNEGKPEQPLDFLMNLIKKIEEETNKNPIVACVAGQTKTCDKCSKVETDINKAFCGKCKNNKFKINQPNPISQDLQNPR